MGMSTIEQINSTLGKPNFRILQNPIYKSLILQKHNFKRKQMRPAIHHRRNLYKRHKFLLKTKHSQSSYQPKSTRTYKILPLITKPCNLL